MEPYQDIEAIRDTVHQRLSGITLNAAEAYADPSDRHDDPDGTQAYRWAIGEIYKAMRPQLADIRRQLSDERPLAGLAAWLGLYEGCHNLKDPHFIGFDLFDDYDEEIAQLLDKELAELAPHLSDALIEAKLELRAIDLIWSRIRFYETNPRSRSFPMLYDLKPLEPLLLGLVRDGQSAAHWLSKFEEEDLFEESAAVTILHACELTENRRLWLEIAHEHAPEEPEVARRLLEYFLRTGDQEAFLRSARSLFRQHPAELSGFLVDHLDAKRNTDLYLTVLSWHTRYHQSIEHYQTLRNLLTEEERNRFIEQLSRDWNPRFYGAVLAVEEQYPALLRVARFQLHADDLINYLRPLVREYPADCLALIRRRTQHLLPRERGQDVYRRIAEELALFLDLPEPWPSEARALATELQQQYPLRSEFHEALEASGLLNSVH